MSTQHTPQAIGPYSLSVAAGPFLFLSGQTPIDPQTGALVGPTIEEQTQQVINNIEAILAKEGLTLEHVVRCDVFLKEMEDFSRMNAIYAERFTHSPKPARTTVAV